AHHRQCPADRPEDRLAHLPREVADAERQAQPGYPGEDDADEDREREHARENVDERHDENDEETEPAHLGQIQAVTRRCRPGLALIRRAELRRAIGPLGGRGERKERELADTHPRIERDRDGVHVRELKRDVTVPRRIDESRGAVDEEAEAPERALALDARADVVRRAGALARGDGHELARWKVAM